MSTLPTSPEAVAGIADSVVIDNQPAFIGRLEELVVELLVGLAQLGPAFFREVTFPLFNCRRWLLTTYSDW